MTNFEKALKTEYRIGYRLGRLEAFNDMKELFEIDIDKLNRMLAAAVRRCLYAVKGYCDPTCQARSYCRPESVGLKDKVRPSGLSDGPR